MQRFRLINSRLRRAGLFLAMVLTLVLATLPTAVMAAPATSDYRRDHDSGGNCGDCYVVQPGDTLSEIAKWFGVSTWELARYNGISNPSKIYVGQKLRIPPSHGHDKECWDDCGGHDKKWDDKECDYNDCGGYHESDYNKGSDCWDDCGGHDKKWDDKECDYNDCGGYHESDYNKGSDCGWDCGGHDKGHDGKECDYNDCGGYHESDYNKGSDCGWDCGDHDKKWDDEGCGHDGCSSHKQHCGHSCYVVQPGDTLSQIAKWYGVSVDYLCRKNDIDNPSKIYVGQVIYI
jgi:LysM repeat protein